MDDHDGGDEEEEDEVSSFGVDDTRVGDEMHRVSDEKGERPAAADEGAGEDAVAVTTLKVDTSAENHEADEIAEADFFGIAERGKFVGEEERDTDDERDDAELVEPIFPEGLLELGCGFARREMGRLRWRREWRRNCSRHRGRMRSGGLWRWRRRIACFWSGRFDWMRRRSRRRRWSGGCGRLGNFQRGRKFYRSGRLDVFWLG